MAPLIETAYHEIVPLLLDHRKWRFAAENCELYLTTFPRGRFVSQMRTWLNQAQIEMGASTGAKPAPTAGAKTAAAPPAETAPAVPAAPAVAPAEAEAPPPVAPAAKP
jgi:hypothetical protein